MAGRVDEEGAPAVETRSCPDCTPGRGGPCSVNAGQPCVTHTARLAHHRTVVAHQVKEQKT